MQMRDEILFAAVRSSVLSALFRRLDEAGANPMRLLSRHGIRPDVLDDPYRAVPISAFVAIFEAAADEAGDPMFGARLGMGTQAGDMGPVGLLLSLSGSVGVGLHRFARSTAALQHRTETTYAEAPDEHVFTYRLPEDAGWPRRQDAEYSLVSVLQILRSSFALRLTPVAVHFEHAAPADPSVLSRFFRCRLEFGQAANRIILAPDDCARVYRAEDSALIETLERHVDDLIGAIPDGETLTDTVGSLIGVALGRGPVTLEAIARRLGLSPRSLQRRLAAEGTGFRALLDARRQELARRQLADRGNAVADVAQALGYADGTALWRAHRRWTSASPSAARRPGRAGGPDEEATSSGAGTGPAPER